MCQKRTSLLVAWRGVSCVPGAGELPGRCISVFLMEGTRMFTEKPESGKTVTKSGTPGDTKTVFAERPATYASKTPGPSASRSGNTAAHNHIFGGHPTHHLPLVAEHRREPQRISPSISPSSWTSLLEVTLPLIVRSSPTIDGTILLALGPGVLEA